MNVSPSTRICSQAGRASGSTNCGRKARKNSAVFGLRTLTTTPSAKSRRRRRGGRCGSVSSGSARPSSVRIPITIRYSAPSSLDDGERGRRRDEDRREADGGEGEVHERADVDAEHRGEPGAAALVDAPRDDVDDGRPRHGQDRERREREHGERLGLDDHALSSQTRRRPSSVRMRVDCRDRARVRRHELREAARRDRPAHRHRARRGSRSRCRRPGRRSRRRRRTGALRPSSCRSRSAARRSRP